MADAGSQENLFGEFDKGGKEDWVKKVLSDLKGSPFDSLVWRSSENIEIQPFYTSEDTKKLDYIESFQHSFANTENPAYGPRHWTNYELIHVADGKPANKAALNALDMGADGLLFKLGNPGASLTPAVLLDQVLCEHCHVSFLAEENSMGFMQDYLEYLLKNGNNPQNIHGFYGRDAIATWTMGGDALENHYFRELAGLFGQTQDFPGFKPLTISSQALEHSGANLVQELAYTLNMAVDYFDQLTDEGLSPERIIRGTQFSLASGSDFFMEIAKFRAFRILFHQLALNYGLKGYRPGAIKIHGTSAYWNKTLADINNNMLRNTSEAMAAIIGGCDSIQITPHDDIHRNPMASSQRIARNISSILRDEAYLDKVVDPVAGSYYLENLTHELVKAAWALFREVEKAGGFISSFKANKIQETLQKTRTQKFLQIANRRTVIVGVNQYPDKSEKLTTAASGGTQKDTGQAQDYELLTPHRASEQFETLRMKTIHYAKEQLNGTKPGIFAATLGNKSPMQKARVSFIDTFFVCAGFKIQISSPGNNFTESIDEAAGAEEKIVVICGSNEDYQEKALDFVKHFKAKDTGKMLWLAGIPPGEQADFPGAGLDGFIHINSDVIATVGQIQRFLGIDKGEEVKLL